MLNLPLPILFTLVLFVSSHPARAADEKSRSKISPAVRQSVARWIDSKYSRTRIGKAEIQFLPEPLPVTFTNKSSAGKPRKAFAYVPVPECIDGNLPREDLIKIKMEVVPFIGVTDEQRLGPVTLVITLRPIGAHRFDVRVESIDEASGGYRYTWQPIASSLYKILREKGQAMEVNPCRGNERKEFLKLFD